MVLSKIYFLVIIVFSNVAYGSEVSITLDDFNFSNQVGMEAGKKILRL